jgi:hypothetical protein
MAGFFSFLILLVIFKEPLIKSGLNFSGDKVFRFKAQVAENSPLFSRFVTQKRDIFALKK